MMKLTEAQQTEIDRFNEIINYNRVITESAQDKYFLKYMKSKGYDYNKAMEFRGELQSDIPNLRIENGKFLSGAARMYFDGELENAENIGKLNNSLKYITGTHSNEYDYNLNGETVQQLYNKFNVIGAKQVEGEKEVFKNKYRQYQGGNVKGGNIQLEINGKNYTFPEFEYNVVKIDSHEEAKKYGNYTDWCITQKDGKSNYSGYTCGGFGRFYFLLMPGFQNIPREMGDNYPYDMYGISMIAISVTVEGELNTCTLRWNHEGANDNMFGLDKNNISQFLSNTDFHTIFQPYSKEEIETKENNLYNEYLENNEHEIVGQDIFFYYTNDLNTNILRRLLNNFKTVMFNEEMDLENNKLTSLPESFGNLRVNGYLDLSSNKLTSLPESFGNLMVGGELDLSNNKLTSLPESFGNIKVRGSIGLHRNPIPYEYIKDIYGYNMEDNEELNKFREVFRRNKFGERVVEEYEIKNTKNLSAIQESVLREINRFHDISEYRVNDGKLNESQMTTKHSARATEVMRKMGWRDCKDLYDQKPSYISGKSGGVK